MSYLDALPDEIFTSTLAYVDGDALALARVASRRWRDVVAARDEHLRGPRAVVERRVASPQRRTGPRAAERRRLGTTRGRVAAERRLGRAVASLQRRVDAAAAQMVRGRTGETRSIVRRENGRRPRPPGERARPSRELDAATV